MFLAIRLLEITAIAILVLVLADGIPWAFGVRHLGLVDPAVLVFLWLTVLASHYVIPGWSKLRLGPHWHSWFLSNRLHYLVAAAYLWGWCAFLPEGAAAQIVRRIAKVDRGLAIFALVTEVGSCLLLLDANLAGAWLGAVILFHLGVFLASGICFWENVVIATALLVLLGSSLGVADRAHVFGVANCLLSIVIIAALPLRGWGWAPHRLSWWDSPFVGMIRWEVTGYSGTVYDIRNDFMCPHERLFGRVHGFCWFPVKVLHYHLGIVPTAALRDAVVATRGSPEKLAALQRQYGVDAANADERRQHDSHLRQFLTALNNGARKQFLPRGLRWLKAPGGQWYYWAPRPKFRGQERVTRLRLIYRERFFDGVGFLRLREQVVQEIEIGAT